MLYRNRRVVLYRNRRIVIVLCLFATGIWLFNLIKQRDASTSEKPTWRRDDPAYILNETLGFQKVYVINLPSRSDRRDTMALAGALTGVKFDWIDGVYGDDVPDTVLPADSLDKRLSKGNKGSWRAHMNALRTIIELNLTSALILEDDADWDIRLKTQLQAFAVASRGFLQPLQSDPSNSLSSLSLSAGVHRTADDDDDVVLLPDLPPTTAPTTSAYGDDWDVLWLGHCGSDFPTTTSSSPSSSQNRDPPLSKLASTTPGRLPRLRVAIPDDETVPGRAHMRPHPFALPDALGALHAAHTRVVHAATGTVCTQAYAVSARGARRLLWLFGSGTLTVGWDLALRDWCDGFYRGAEAGDGDEEAGVPACLTVQPPLFNQHYGKGGKSDITAPGGGYLNSRKEMTPYVRLSVRMNMGRLVRGDGVEMLVDQWPDRDGG